eukprot:7741348-Alexandrium_andersonii.AAC.1
MTRESSARVQAAWPRLRKCIPPRSLQHRQGHSCRRRRRDRRTGARPGRARACRGWPSHWGRQPRRWRNRAWRRRLP